MGRPHTPARRCLSKVAPDWEYECYAARPQIESALGHFQHQLAKVLAIEQLEQCFGEGLQAHHHGPLESVIYVVKGKARMRWGEHLEFTAEAGPGDFIYVPPFVPHQEINASATEVLECVLCRSDGQAVAVNLDIEPVEKPENVLWVDPTHPHGGV